MYLLSTYFYTILGVKNNPILLSLANHPIKKWIFWLWVANALFLTWVGGNPVEDPYITLGQLSSTLYFMYFI
jgi:quinol-cytochrome oxidoreductase complex cytochrome b subunit